MSCQWRTEQKPVSVLGVSYLKTLSICRCGRISESFDLLRPPWASAVKPEPFDPNKLPCAARKPTNAP